MLNKERVYQRCLDEMEQALLEFIEMYGPTEKAKLAISRLALVRAALGF